LKSVGVATGDAVVTYPPMLMELAIAMLACARITAVYSVLFSWFGLLIVPENIVYTCSHCMALNYVRLPFRSICSAKALPERIIGCKPKVVITFNAVKKGSETGPS
jgi:acyl-coenzyme A synthetase/AMP-(fatty) acid ligase